MANGPAASAGAAEHSALTRQLARALDEAEADGGLDAPIPCPYLPGRQARHLTVLPAPVLPGVYHALMDLNFRRLGPVFYRTACEGCEECRMLRVEVDAFAPTRAQRRCRSRNADVAAALVSSAPDDEKLALYRRYLDARHDGQMEGSELELRALSTGSAVDTREVEYRVAGRLVAVGVVDLEPRAMSAVYCYFDPGEPRRSLGVFNVLWMIDECRRRGLPWLYLGYWVRDAPKMSYKAGFGPCETLRPDGTWSRYRG